MPQRSRHMVIGASILCCLLVITIFLVGLPARSSYASNETVSVWLTTADGTSHLTQQSSLTFSSGTSSSSAITVDDTQKYQQMVGFGAAMTDSSTWLMANKMSTSQRDAVLSQLFDPNAGIGLDFVRIPMGSSDEAVNGPYSYDDLPDGQTDPTLAHFSIAHDTTYTLPILKQALQLNPNLVFMANPWSPPAWMKTNNSMYGDPDGHSQGTLKAEDYEPLAQYFVKFIQAYQGQGIPISYVTPENEPLFAPGDYPGMYFAASDESNFIKNNLGPDLASAQLSTKILAYDHNWGNTDYAQTILNDSTTNSYVSGIAWHCYDGDPSAMSYIHGLYPNKDAFETECSTGTNANQPAAAPINTIDLLIQSTQNWARTVTLWSMAMDPGGNPHSGGCGICAGVVTIDQSTGNVTYNDAYYQLGHFSKFVLPGAYHISSNNVGNVEDSAFQNTDGSRVLIAHNNDSNDQTVAVNWNNQTFSYTLPAGATVTFTWNTSTGVTPTPTPTGGSALSRTGWVATASATEPDGSPGNALDGDLTTRWSTGHTQTNGDWFSVDMQSPQSFNKIVLDTTNSPNDYPVGYQVFVSNDGSTWGSAIASGSGSTITTITFSSQNARYIKIVETGSSSSWWWSIDELNVYAPGGNTPTPTPTATSTPGQLVIAINAGGGATGNFIADTDVNQGNQYADTSSSIDTSGVPNPAPQAVYQSCRWNSAFTYTIPHLTAGVSYRVRLHWAELTFQANGSRVFNVAINGSSVLSNFDVYATAGYKKALVKEFAATANSSGNIAIAFTQGGADNPFINGIEIYTT